MAEQIKQKLTRRAFKAMLNGQTPGSGRKLYRNRPEFNKQYAAWREENGETIPEPANAEVAETELEDKASGLIKSAMHEETLYEHVRYPNGKTAYLKEGKVTTKAKLPQELGW